VVGFVEGSRVCAKVTYKYNCSTFETTPSQITMRPPTVSGALAVSHLSPLLLNSCLQLTAAATDPSRGHGRAG
jgi:hypothetical protein